VESGHVYWAISIRFPSMARNGPLATVALSGILGYWIGYRCLPAWQVAIEPAQVIAGIVTYPIDNPNYIYEIKLWTVLHQVLAPALRAGVSEIALSQILSGVVGMMALQALSLFVFAFSRDVLYAVASGFVIFLSGAAQFSGTYPIDWMGTTHTYGVIGQSALVLTFAAFGSGALRAGALLLGMMPAIHPSLGIWAGVIVSLALLTDARRLVAALRPALPWFAAGCAITIVSFADYWWRARGVTPVPAAVADHYVKTFITLWDGHRTPATLQHPEIYLNNPAVRLSAAAIPIALIWIGGLRATLPRGADLAVRLILASACVACGLVLVSFVTGGWLPDVVQMLMPMRLLNIAGMTFAAWTLGVLGAWRRRWAWGETAAILLMIALLLGDRTRLLLPPAINDIRQGGISTFAIVLIAMVAATVRAWMQRNRPAHREEPAGLSRLNGGVAAVRTLAVAALVVFWVYTTTVHIALPLIFRDRAHDPVFGAASVQSGLLLTGGTLHLIQLRTRRPVLLDGGGTDGIVYTSAAAPAMDQIVKDVYGIDMFEPSAQVRDSGEPISPGINRQNWELYSHAKWLDIRRRYGVTQVLTPTPLQLALPLVAETQDLRLYDIPLQD